MFWVLLILLAINSQAIDVSFEWQNQLMNAELDPFNRRGQEENEKNPNQNIKIQVIIFYNPIKGKLNEKTLQNQTCGYKYSFITSYAYVPLRNVKKLLSTLEEIFYSSQKLLPNAIILYSNCLNNEPNDENFITLATNIIKQFKIPTFTYLPFRTAHEDEESLMLRLEPTSFHVASSIINFIANYNWSMIAFVYSSKLHSSETLLSNFQEIQDQKDNENKSFELVLRYELKSPTNTEDLSAKIDVSERLLKPYYDMFDSIINHQSNIIIMNVDIHDLSIIMNIYQKAKEEGINKTLQLFTSQYSWIFTPAILEKQDSIGTTDPSVNNNLIPGLFAFSVEILDEENMFKMACKMWCDAYQKLVDQLGQVDPSYYQRNINKPHGPYWNYSVKLFQLIRNQVFSGAQGKKYSFLPNGRLTGIEIVILNSVITKSSYEPILTERNQVHFKHAATWRSYSDEDRNLNYEIVINGIKWLGDSNNPPPSKPQKLKLQVVTMKEVPFVNFARLRDGKCDSTMLPCKVRRESMEELMESEIENSNLKHQQFNTSVCCTGLTIDMLIQLMKDLDFEVDLYEVPDGFWGGYTTEQGWNGMVKEIIDLKADMAVSSFKITPKRTEMIDFSVPFLETGIGFIVAVREGAISPTAFLRPYDYQTWCVILVFSVHATATALFIYEWLSPHGLDRGNFTITEHRFSLFRALWLIWSMLFGAAVNANNPRGAASRFLANIWALFALVFLASYTANLAAFMIAQDSFHDLVGMHDERLSNPYSQNPPFRYATVPSGATDENIRSNFPKRAEYLNNRVFNITEPAAALPLLKTFQLDTFLYDSNVLEYLASKDDNCMLRTVGNPYAMTGYGIAFPKGQKRREKIDHLILEYIKNGQMQRWKKFWLAGACKKESSLRNSNKKLGVKNFISAFILLLCGILFCTILLMFEHLFYRYVRPRVKKLDKYGCCGLVSIVFLFFVNLYTFLKSMGQIMSFEESVSQTINLVKRHHCPNQVCELKLQKLQQESAILRRFINNHFMKESTSNLTLNPNIGKYGILTPVNCQIASTKKIKSRRLNTEEKFIDKNRIERNGYRDKALSKIPLMNKYNQEKLLASNMRIIGKSKRRSNNYKKKVEIKKEVCACNQVGNVNSLKNLTSKSLSEISDSFSRIHSDLRISISLSKGKCQNQSENSITIYPKHRFCKKNNEIPFTMPTVKIKQKESYL